ncbi:MAG: hypothetical protein HOE96_02185 [Candidatus Marinimicrobia bacterium]|jgi:hypothetical protein|nr:hypothetical protein [Candidatus Neomarinimicrobiota bacterium]
MNDELKNTKKTMAETLQKLFDAYKPNMEQQKAMMELSKPFIDEQKKMAKLMEPLVAQHTLMVDAMKPTLKIVQSIRESILPSIKLIENWQKQFMPLFDNSQIENLIKWKERTDSKEYQSFMAEWGWFFRKRNYSFGDYCFGLYKKFGDNELKNQLIQWFNVAENITPLVEEIKIKFPGRYSVLQDGFNFHSLGNFASSITLMLPHTEGILWEIGQKKCVVETKYTSEKRVENNVAKSTKWKLSGLAEKLFPNDKFHKIIVKEIFCAGPRDKILHGRNIDHNTDKECNSWLSTLLILTLWRLADEVKNVG